MNKTIQALLSADKSKFDRTKKTVEVKRLSEIAGDPVVFTLESKTAFEMEDLLELTENEFERGVQLIVESVEEFKDRELMKAYGAPTPKELVNKILLPGEIIKLSGIIMKMSGYGDTGIEEIKN